MRNLKFTFLFFITLNCFSQSADMRLLRTINAREMPMWDEIMKGVSFSVYPAMPLTVVGVWSFGYFDKDKEMMRNSYKSALTIGLANSISFGLKLAVKRDRPFVTHPNDIKQRTHVGPLSFPSGHTTAAFATATAISLSTKKWQVAVPSYAYAGFVAYSRMRLGVHYPTDLVGGIVVGIGSGLLIWQIDKWIHRSKKSVIVP